jgi:hypothetical protein
MRRITGVLFAVAMAMVASGALGQEKVESLQDLIGARGRDGEYQLQQRGYKFIRGEKSGNDSYTYWQESENGQCIVVRTAEGRYASIVYAMDFSCQGGATAQPHGGGGLREDKFKTVCGAMANGNDYKYRCTATDFYDGAHKVKTLLEFPDQNLELVWKSGKTVELRFEGMVPKQVQYSTYEGETNFVFEGKTYFYWSNKESARLEYEHFKE